MMENGDANVTDATTPSNDPSGPASLDEHQLDPLTDEAGVVYELVPDDESDAIPETVPPVAAPAPSGARPASPGRMVLGLVLVALVIGAAVWGALAANDRWGHHAMVATGLVGIEDLIQGRGDKLAALSNATIKAQLTPDVRSAMAGKGIVADFATPVWTDDSVKVKATTGMGEGALIVGPATGGKDVVVFQTMGALSYTTGAVSLVRTWSGWQISGLTVEASKLPTTTPSASSTSSAPSTTTTP
jgi:hypothetical protein